MLGAKYRIKLGPSDFLIIAKQSEIFMIIIAQKHLKKIHYEGGLGWKMFANLAEICSAYFRVPRK